jgi:hypothetical protein
MNNFLGTELRDEVFESDDQLVGDTGATSAILPQVTASKSVYSHLGMLWALELMTLG